MSSLVQTLILGLLVGALYALIASGLTLIFGVMQVINLAHGAFAVLAAFFTYTLWRSLGLDPLLSIPIVMAVMFAVGWLVYVVAVRHVRGAHVSMTVLATFGIALMLEGVMGFVWGNTSSTVVVSYTDASISLGPSYIPQAMLIAAIVAVAVMGGLYLLLNHTWAGRAIRAASSNENGALLVGVSVATIAALTFSIGVATLGAGGAMLSTRSCRVRTTSGSRACWPSSSSAAWAACPAPCSARWSSASARSQPPHMSARPGPSRCRSWSSSSC
jgi:branched-chain amino acid transport system permease protein